MQFLNKAQETTYHNVGSWMREIFGESVIARKEIPSYVVRAGSALVHVTVFPWEAIDDARVSVSSYVVRSPDVDKDLTHYLLRENDDFRFGAFTIDKDGDITFTYSILGSAASKESVRVAVLAVGGTADNYDDKIVERWGGQTAMEHLGSN
jgi:hypothetical protein